MQAITQDVRYALRVIRYRPLSAALIVIMLAVGVGANTAIFSLVNGVVLRPLALPDADRLVAVYERRITGDLRDGLFPASPPKLVDWRQQSESFERLSAYVTTWVTITGDLDTERVPASRVSPELFELLGAIPALGRPFQTEEYESGGAAGGRVAVLSDAFWRRKFAADAAIVGRTVQMNGQPHRIVGVLPPIGEELGLGAVLLPFAERIDNRQIQMSNVLGRLRADVTLEQARVEMEGIAARLALAYPATDSGWSVALVPLHEVLVGEVSGPLMVLLAAVGVVLLIACVNIVHLLLARSDGRSAEIAVRASLGASRGRIVRQMLTESAVLGLLGSVAAVIVGRWALLALLATAPQDLLQRAVPALDGAVFAFGLVLSVGAAVLAGVLPALRHTRPVVVRATAVMRTRGLMRPALMVTEVALAFVLAVGAGLLMRSFATLTAVDPGFRAAGVLTARVSLAGSDADVRLFAGRLLELLESLPGVDAAEVSNSIPLGGGPPWFNIEAAAPGDDGETHAGPGPMRVVTPGYFAAAGIELLAGRDFTDRDSGSARPVVVLDEKLAQRLFPAGAAVGRRVRTYYDEPVERDVIGVVAGVKEWGLSGMTSAGYYVPLEQVRWSTLYVVVQTDEDAGELAGVIRRSVWSLDPDVPVDDIRTMEQRLTASLGEPRFQMLLLTLFGGMSLLLAVGGIAGVTLQAVASRRAEIGIRMALGARGRDVVAMVLRENMLAVTIGLACGAALSYFTTRLLVDLLFQTEPLDAATFAGVAALVSLVATLASWLPARRAAAVDPLIAIRAD